MFYVYIIKSEINDRYYIGSTNNIKRRIMEHNLGKSIYTRLSAPFKLCYFEKLKTLKDARKREYFIKKKKSRIYIEWLIQINR